MTAADVAWMLAALRRVGVGTDESLLAAARRRLDETQRSDGAWPSDDAPAVRRAHHARPRCALCSPRRRRMRLPMPGMTAAPLRRGGVRRRCPDDVRRHSGDLGSKAEAGSSTHLHTSQSQARRWANAVGTSPAQLSQAASGGSGTPAAVSRSGRRPGSGPLRAMGCWWWPTGGGSSLVGSCSAAAWPGWVGWVCGGGRWPVGGREPGGVGADVEQGLGGDEDAEGGAGAAHGRQQVGGGAEAGELDEGVGAALRGGAQVGGWRWFEQRVDGGDEGGAGVRRRVSSAMRVMCSVGRLRRGWRRC